MNSELDPWKHPNDYPITLLGGFIYCPYIPEPFKNWTSDQFEKEIEQLRNLKTTSSFARPIKI